MRIAAAQTSPRWGDAQATTKIVIDWIGRAAEEGVELLAFGETFLSGYPFWVSVTDGARFNDAAQKEAFAFYLDSAVAIDGPELQEIATAARDHRVFTYLGITERSQSRGTVYCTAVAIDPDRGIVGSHRKMMPTYEERLVWGVGDGNGLRARTRWLDAGSPLSIVGRIGFRSLATPSTPRASTFMSLCGREEAT